jgi:hypothetical protein
MNTYSEAKVFFETRRKRKLQNNTYLVKTEEGYGIKLHNTIVVEWLPDRTILNSGGWKTPTTKDRINTYAPVLLRQHKGVWLICYGPQFYNWDNSWNGFVTFADGCYLKDGKWYNVGDDPKTIEKQRKAIRKYSKAFVDAMFASEVEQPGLGDCFYCGMVTVDEKQPLGEAIKDGGHIESHIKENYFVPSLLVNACKMFGVSDAAWWTIHYTRNLAKWQG